MYYLGLAALIKGASGVALFPPALITVRMSRRQPFHTTLLSAASRRTLPEAASAGFEINDIDVSVASIQSDDERTIN